MKSLFLMLAVRKVVAGIIVWLSNICLLGLIGVVVVKFWSNAVIIQFLYGMGSVIVVGIIFGTILWAYSVWYDED